MSEPRIIPLSAIVGRSRFNVRPDGDQAGRAAMGASIRAMGQLQALIVRDEGTPGLYEVDDGGCRWDAMCDLVAADEATPPDHAEPWTWNTDVNVLVVNGDAGRARERSLAANVIRRNLHPVEECEAFADMVRDGVAIATIAADFGVTSRYVRQRLKLDELSQRARAAWRAGTLSAEAAGVITGAADHAAQDAILDRFAEGKSLVNYNLSSLRAELRGRAVRGDDREAVYVGVDAYVAAGGAVNEGLFDDAPLFLDAPLLKRLAAKKLMDFGHVLAERFDFGSVILASDLVAGEEEWRWGASPVKTTEAEDEELEGLDEEQRVQSHGCGALMRQAIVDKFDELRLVIVGRAIERSMPRWERKVASILMKVDHTGRAVADFGRTRPVPEGDGRAAKTQAPKPKPFAASPEPIVEADAVEPAKLGKALVTVLDGALSEGFAVLVQQNPGIALTLAIVALTARRSGDAPVRLGARCWTVDAGDRPKDWPSALAAELAQPQHLPAVLDRFAAAVANTIAVDPGNTYGGDRRADPHQLAAMAELVAHTAGAEDYAEVMWDVLDYEAYFGAATRTATLAAIEEAGGVLSDARKLGKADLAAMAVTLCTDRRWLPRELRMPAAGRIAAALPTRSAPEAPSLADAMADALEADGEDLDGAADEAPPLVFDPQTPEDAIAAFLDRHCLRDDERCRIKAAVVFDAFRERMPPAVVDLLPTMPKFGAAIAQAGIAKRRTSDGFHYCGLDLRPVEQPRQAAE